MPGIRVQHPTQRDVRYTVVEPLIPYPQGYQCTPPELGGCGVMHQFKTHHLNLDSTGSVILSTTVYERLKHRLSEDGFITTNEVQKPPRLGIGLAPGKGTTTGITIVAGMARRRAW